MEVGPALIQTDAPAIPTESLGKVTGPTTATIGLDLREHLRPFEGLHVVEEAEFDHPLVQWDQAEGLACLDRLRLTIVLVGGANAKAPDALALDQIGLVQLTEFASPEPMKSPRTGSQYAASPPAALNRLPST